MLRPVSSNTDSCQSLPGRRALLEVAPDRLGSYAHRGGNRSLKVRRREVGSRGTAWRSRWVEMPQYFLKEGSAVLRGPDAHQVPTEVLWRSGWVPWTRSDPRGTAGPEAMRPLLEPVTEAEARQVASRRGLPLDNW